MAVAYRLTRAAADDLVMIYLAGVDMFGAAQAEAIATVWRQPSASSLTIHAPPACERRWRGRFAPTLTNPTSSSIARTVMVF